jgi:hypothetical protein
MSTFHGHQSHFGSAQRAALAIGVVAIALAIVPGVFDAERFFESYLWVFVYWWLISMGCLGLGLIYQMTGGAWGQVSRPFVDAGMRTLPLVAIGFIPLALNLHHVYGWTASGYFAGRPHTENRQWYLSEMFFVGRAAGYFAISLVFCFVLTRGRVDGEEGVSQRTSPRFGALGAVLTVLVVSFAATDWGMSLDPDWFSTIYGGLFVVGGLLSAMSVVAAGVALAMSRSGQLREDSTDALHDLGKLLLAMLMLWAYFAFSQFLIIYSGNLPVEAVWYTRRLAGGWQYLALLIVLLHFAVPFGLLLSREAKRNPTLLAAISMGIALVRGLDVYWLIVPSFRDSGFRLHWLDPLVFVGLGGPWVFEYLRHLNKRLIDVRSNEAHSNAADRAAEP